MHCVGFVFFFRLVVGFVMSWFLGGLGGGGSVLSADDDGFVVVGRSVGVAERRRIVSSGNFLMMRMAIDGCCQVGPADNMRFPRFWKGCEGRPVRRRGLSARRSSTH